MSSEQLPTHRVAIKERTGSSILKRLAIILALCPTVTAIRAALESVGVIFVDENGEGPGVRLRKAPQGAEGLGK
jgi:hypothetical protein